MTQLWEPEGCSSTEAPCLIRRNNCQSCADHKQDMCTLQLEARQRISHAEQHSGSFCQSVPHHLGVVKGASKPSAHALSAHVHAATR